MTSEERAEMILGRIRNAAAIIAADPEVLEALHPRNLDVTISQMTLAFEEKLKIAVGRWVAEFDRTLRDLIPGGSQEPVEALRSAEEENPAHVPQ